MLLLQLIFSFILLNFATTSKFLEIVPIPVPHPTIWHGRRREERWLVLIRRNLRAYPFRAKISKVMLRSGNSKTRNCIFSYPVLPPLTKLDCCLISLHVCDLWKCKPSETERNSSHPHTLGQRLPCVHSPSFLVSYLFFYLSFNGVAFPNKV